MRLPGFATLMPLVFYAASGGAFALANLVVARRLAERDYAFFTLLLTMMSLGPALAAAGLDGVAVRGGLQFVPQTMRRVWLAAAVVALALGVAAATYDIGIAGLVLIMAASTFGGAGAVAAAEFQRLHRFTLSLLLLHTPNYALLGAAVLATALGAGETWLPLVAMLLGYVGAAGYGWWLVMRESPGNPDAAAVPWREAISLASTNGSGAIMVQLDRLIIPYLLPFGALATYGILSAVAGSLFRIVQRGVGYTLLPRLRATSNLEDRRRLLLGEGRLVGAVALGGSFAIWAAMPAVEHWLLADRYHFSGALVLATLVAGCAKLVHAFSRAGVTALAEARELRLMNLLGWVSLAVSVIGAVVGARWGLAGVIYGVSLGWLFRTAAAVTVMYRHLRAVARPATS